MIPQLGAPVGFRAANGLFLVLGAILSPAQCLARGAPRVRLKPSETPASAAAMAKSAPADVSSPRCCALCARPSPGTFAVVACFALFYLATAFAVAQALADRGGLAFVGRDLGTAATISLVALLLSPKQA